jgi:indoleamine 2,3-dioxygenase
MLPPIPRLRDYDVSALNGFLPTDPPCEGLANGYYAPWESVVNNLQALILTKRLRKVVDNLPVLETHLLESEAEWRRAYSILGFMTHAYMWGGDMPEERIPPPVSVPFLQTCEHLELPSVGTYAGVVLWNWKPLLQSEPVDNLNNLFTIHTLSGSLDESWFFLVSVAIEARGAPIIPLMLDAVEAARYNDQELVTEALRMFAERLDELRTLLSQMYENCDPHVFYHRIRPLLAGSKNMAEAGLPNGVIFDTESPDDEYVQYSGGSNAQSSIIQFFDIILGIEHRPTGQKPGLASHGAPSNSFIHEMRKYMPGPHRRFLEAVEKVANIRSFVVAHPENRALSTAYDACLAMLRAFRDTHIQIVSRYIIVKSREGGSRSTSNSPPRPGDSITTPFPPKKLNLAVASSRGFGQGGEEYNGSETIGQRESRSLRRLKGTGGTALIPFLKQARDETGEPAIDAWARRLLNNGPGTSLTLSYHGDWESGSGGARLSKMAEHASGEREIVGLAGVWKVDDSEGGICHW